MYQSYPVEATRSWIVIKLTEELQKTIKKFTAGDIFCEQEKFHPKLQHIFDTIRIPFDKIPSISINI